MHFTITTSLRITTREILGMFNQSLGCYVARYKSRNQAILLRRHHYSKQLLSEVSGQMHAREGASSKRDREKQHQIHAFVSVANGEISN